MPLAILSFFNTEQAEPCDSTYLFRGHYLIRDLREEIHGLVHDMNLVIQDAVNVVDRRLGGPLSGQRIFFMEWDILYEGHRFCEPGKDWKTDAWFLTIAGDDQFTNGTHFANTVPPGEEEIIQPFLGHSCNPNGPDPNVASIRLYTKYLLDGGEPAEDIGTALYPAWVLKVMYPKTPRRLATI